MAAVLLAGGEAGAQDVEHWSATLTRAEGVGGSDGRYGYVATTESDPGGTLDPSTFTYAGVSYTVNRLYVSTGGVTAVFETSPALPNNADLVLRLPTFRTVANGPCLVGGTEDFDLDADGAHASVTGRYEWNAHFSGSCLTVGDWTRDLSTTGTVKLIEPPTTDPVWSTTMTVGEVKTVEHGYHGPSGIGALDDDDFEYGSPAVTYTVQRLDVGTNTILFLVDKAGLPEADTLTLELAGHEFAFSARDSENSTGRVWVWLTPDELDEPATEFPVGATATVCLRTATQVCPAGRIVTPLSPDATLSGLSLGSGVTLIPTFASSTATYTASVANSVSEVTVTPTTNHASSTVAYLDASDAALADADTNAAGHQVALAVGETVIKVKVTAEDGTSTQTYTVTVTRAAAPTTCTLATGDIWCGVLTVGSNSAGSRNGYHSGQYGQLSDTKFDLSSTEYTVESIRWVTATGQRKDLILDLDALPASSVWGAWYLQVDASKYSTDNAEEVSGAQIGFTNAYGPPRTPPALNTAVTVRLTTSSTGALSSFPNLSALTVNDGNGNADLTLSPAFDTDTDEYTTSVASGVGTVTITATPADRGSVYYEVGSTRLVDADAMAAGFQVTLEPGVNTISVIVVSEDGGYLQQYYVEVTRPAALDTPTSFAAEADDAQVTLSWDAPASGSGVTGHEYRFKEGTGAYGDWMQIADSGVGGANEAGFTVTGLTNYRAHVFQLRAAGAGGYSTPATSEEVTPVLPDDFPEDTTTSGVVAVGGSATGALESVDDTADWFRVVLEAGKTYQIDMEGSETGRGDLVDPILLGIYDALGTLVLGFGSGVDDAGQGLNSRATFTPSAAGTYYVVASGVGSHTGGYTLFVREAMPADATLSALMVNDGSSDLTLTPAFASGTYAYTVSVANAVDEVTVTPTTNQAAATFAWLDADDNALDDAGTSTGHQVALAVGANVIKVKVTAGDGTSTQTYTVTVTRAAAMTCTLATGDIWCGVLTVGSNSGGSRNGYHSGQYGQLSDTKFDLSSTEYTVESIRWVTATGQRKDLILDLDALPAEDVLNAWYLQVDANKYQIANAQWEVTGDQIEFTNAYGPPRTPPALNTAVTVRLTTSSTGALSVEAALSALTVNDGNADLTLSPAFDRDTYDYTTSVASGVETVTFTATVIDDGSVIYRVGTTTTTLVDADAMAAGFQVTLEVGANAIDVDALSEDGGFREVYTVTVTRAGAVDTPTSFATEADDAQVTLSWDAPASGSGVTGHEYRYKSGTGSYPANFTEIPDSGVGGANEDGFTVTELTNDTVHVFQLRAAGGGGYSAPATSEEVTPAVADDFPADTTTSGVVAVGGSATGVIGLADDYDWFRVMLAAGKTYQIDMEGSETGRGDLDDPFLWAIHDGVGALVLDLTLDPGIDDGGQGFNSRATFTPSAAGTYHVEVTGRGSSTGGYTLFVREAMPADATLSALMVNDGSSDLTLTPAFASGTYAYTVSVANAVDEITVTPTTNQTAATFAWLDADDNALADADTTTGHQVALAVGANVFKVKVTGGDGTSTLTYTVTVTRAAAMTPATCTLNTGDVWCGVLTVAAGDGGSTSQGGTPNGYVGAGSSYKGSDTFGALSDTDFPVTHEGMTTTYTIQSIRWGTGSDSEERLFFELDARPPNAVADTWTLQIGSYNIKIHGFNDWSITHEAYTFFVGFGMTTPPASGSTVTVRLRKAAAAPTNFEAAVGDAQVVLSWDPPDSGSGVTRHEYRQKEGTGSYPANFTQIADSGVGGANEDGFTVTGLTNEVVHTFQLRAVDASGDGTAAEAGPVTPTPGICGRTQKVHENIVYYLENLYSVERTCAEVNVADLESFTVSLEMAGYEIASLKSGDFAGLSNLQTLELSSNTFTTLPANVFSGLTSLEILKLISGELSSLDARALSGLTTLQTLLLQSNDLDSLPGTVFTGLTALGTLELQENDLGTLPAGVFSGLAALHTLHLYDNDLTALPAGVFSGLSALEVLDLNDNDLTALPAGVFSGLSALEVLNLTDNDLDSLPGTVFSGLSNLLTLGLQNNDLSSLPDGLFFSLTAVTALKVDGNPVDPLPLTVTVEKFGTDQARAKVLAGAPFAVEFTATVVNGSLPTGVTKLGVAKGSVEGTPVTVERTTGMTGAVTVDIDLTTQPSLPTNHSGYEFEKAPSGLPVEILRATDSDATLSALVVNDGSADLTLTPAFSAETYAYAAAVARTVETVTVTPTKAISGAAVAYLDADDMAIADADTAAGQQVGLEPGENTIKVKVTATNMTDTLTYTLTVRRARPGICDRTEQIRTAILAEIAGVSDCADVTATHLAAITTFGGNIGFGTAIKGITALKPGDFAGLTALTLLNLSVNQLTALPAGIFSDLTAVTKIELEANRLASLPEGVFAGLAKLTAIGLYGNRLTGIPAGVFAGLPALTEIELTSNRLTGLPDGTFAGLAGLSYLKMDLNPDLAPFAVTLEKRTGVAEVRAVMPVGAPFAVPVPVALDNGTLAGDATAITVPAGATESDWVAVTRTAGTTGAVTVDVVLSTQPTLPSAHSGYAFGRGSGLPVTAIEATADDMPPDAPAGLMAMHTTTAAEVALSWTAATGVASYQYRFRVEDGDYSPWTAIADSASGEANAAGFTVTGLVNGFPHTFQVRARGSGTASGASNEAATTPGTGLGICDRTRQVRDAIVSKIAAADDCAAVTSAHLAGLERLNMSGDFQLRAGDLDGLTGLKQFSVNDSHQTGLSGSGLESLLAGIFSDLTNLRSLYLGDNRLSTLPDGVFGGLSKLKLLSLEDNQFAALPDGVFEGLTSLAVLSLRDNPGSPLAVPVNLEKVGTDQVKAVVPTGAPFELALTVSLTDADPATVTLTVSTGAVESAAATVARAADKTGAVVASLGTLPSLPTSKPSDAEFTHGGYALRAGEAKTILPESSAPQNFAAAPGDGRVVLSWDAPASDSGVTKHQYRQKAGAGTYEDWTDIANSAAGEANVGGFTVTGLTNETAYTFELRRFIGTSEGAAAEAGPVTPTPGICDRTQQVRDAIVARVSGAEKCNEVTVADLAGIGFLRIVDKGLTALEAGDFAGLTALETLSVTRNPSLTALPSGVFSGLTALVGLTLSENGLETLPANVFSGLTALEQVALLDNALRTLPAGVFSGLTRVQNLALQGNDLTFAPRDRVLRPDGVAHSPTARQRPDLAPRDRVLRSARREARTAGQRPDLAARRAVLRPGRHVSRSARQRSDCAPRRAVLRPDGRGSARPGRQPRRRRYAAAHGDPGEGGDEPGQGEGARRGAVRRGRSGGGGERDARRRRDGAPRGDGLGRERGGRGDPHGRDVRGADGGHRPLQPAGDAQ